MAEHVTDTSTRQRLLELHKRCPECRPIQLAVYSPWNAPNQYPVAFARDAMAQKVWSTGASIRNCGDHWHIEGGRHRLQLEFLGEPGDLNYLTDALISAVEAVLDADEEKQ